jgi:molybdate transport system substrate-binding protein
MSLKLLSSMATKSVLAELSQAFTRAHGTQIEIESIGGVDAAKRVRAGDPADVVVLAAQTIEQLIGEGKLRASSRADLVKSGISLAVANGTVRPDISSEAAVCAAVLSAKSVSYSTGPSGVYLEQLFIRWGIADQVKSKIVQAPPGIPVASLIASGKVELGFQQLTELMNMKGVEILGPLPSSIQLFTTFSAGLSTNTNQLEVARCFVDFMISAHADQTKRDQGMETVS